ncbi:hypothetical protein [Oleiagrimonas sp.]|uniref:hypothetical protein n=1 Tax=Oleiagrimonas sp. TaxID=2010330 RepID=UPI002633F3DD|nr:hypothetical protein [Oleiagrimonas sp.]MDA3912559.1 hypothetical protein [Oleiagrimonas sp.]
MKAMRGLLHVYGGRLPRLPAVEVLRIGRLDLQRGHIGHAALFHQDKDLGRAAVTVLDVVHARQHRVAHAGRRGGVRRYRAVLLVRDLHRGIELGFGGCKAYAVVHRVGIA